MAEKSMIVAGSRGLQLRTIDDFWRFADGVAKSGLAPRGLNKPEAIMVALEYGAELGLAPMQALSTVMVVNQRPALFGDGMLAVAQSSGLLEDIVETCDGDETKPDTLKATCKVKRKGRPTPVVKSFSWAQARQAGLTSSDTYKKYPARMLQHRARALALRDAMPDVLCGIMTVDEAREIPSGADSAPAFVDGAEQPTSDLDALAATVEEDVAKVAEVPLVESPDAKPGVTVDQTDLFGDYPDPNEVDAQAVAESNQ